jgi:hypothetical protein
MIVPIIGIYCINQPISTNHIILDISQTGTDVTELVAAFGKAAVAFFPPEVQGLECQGKYGKTILNYIYIIYSI